MPHSHFVIPVKDCPVTLFVIPAQAGIHVEYTSHTRVAGMTTPYLHHARKSHHPAPAIMPACGRQAGEGKPPYFQVAAITESSVS